MNKVQALHSFWSGFGLKAYDATHVPDEAVLPYITYEVSTDSFGEQLSQTASLWYRSSSWKDIQEKELEIAEYIGRGGRMVAYDASVGYLDNVLLYQKAAFWIHKGTPWAIRVAGEGDEMVKRIMMNIEVEFID